MERKAEIDEILENSKKCREDLFISYYHLCGKITNQILFSALSAEELLIEIKKSFPQLDESYRNVVEKSIKIGEVARKYPVDLKEFPGDFGFVIKDCLCTLLATAVCTRDSELESKLNKLLSLYNESEVQQILIEIDKRYKDYYGIRVIAQGYVYQYPSSVKKLEVLLTLEKDFKSLYAINEELAMGFILGFLGV